MSPRVRLGVSAILLAATVALLEVLAYGDSTPLRKPLESFPAAVGGWQSVGGTILDAETLAILRPSDYLMRRYGDGAGNDLWLYVGYWDTQRKGAQMHSPKNCLPGGGWEPLESKRVTLPLGGAAGSIEVNEYLLQREGDLQIVYYWFFSQGEPEASEVGMKLDLVKNAIVRHRTDGAIVRVSAAVTGGRPATEARLQEFIHALGASLAEHLPA